MTTQSETPRTPLLQRLHARLDSDYKLRRMSSLARGLEMTEMPGETEQLLIDATSEVTALTAANADLTAQLAEARRDAERLRERANNLFGALLEFHNAFHNRGETTSLHEWNKRMKRADEHACQILPIPPSTKQ